MSFSHILIASCLYLIGASQAIDNAAGVPWKPDGMPWWDCSWGGCTTSILGGPTQYADDSCYLPLHFNDPWYSAFWCQSTVITGQSGPVEVQTPCLGDPGVILATNAPYAIRVYWGRQTCPEEFDLEGLCSGNVCTAQDVINGDCTCTAADEAAELCEP